MAAIKKETQMAPRKLWIVGFAAALFPACQVVRAADICGANLNRGASVGINVSFHGAVSSDGMHATLISPDSCKSEWYGILWTGQDGDPASVIRNAITKFGYMGTGDKDVAVDADGVIVMLPNGKVGIKLTKLNKLVLTYPKTNTDR